VPILFGSGEGHIDWFVNGENQLDTAESETLCMRGYSKRENREIPRVPRNCSAERKQGRFENLSEGKSNMNARGKSDESVVPATSANNDAAEASAEPTEERDSPKRNVAQDALLRTPSRTIRKSRGLHGVREAARKDSRLKFTALLHHVNEDCLRDAFFNLKRTAAAGVDGVTWEEYEQNWEDNLQVLHKRIHCGTYRASPVRRVRIPKRDGRERLLGIAALEDKIVQQAVVWVLQSIYEQDFLGFSYGFRPRRSQHDALDALSVGLTRKRVNWILDADIEGFFDAIDHEWLIKFLEHRVGDPRILRLIRKWLRAGVNEDGEWSKTTVGTPQGAVISPLLANVFLHYVFDLWINWWRRQGRGDVIVIRYADDIVIGFENQTEAKECLEALRHRLAKFGLKLHPEKTRLIEFGRRALERQERGGGPRLGTFDFLGFTHKCARSRTHGRFTIHRHSMAKRMRATLGRIKEELRRRRHHSIGETGRWLRRVVQGWLNYHAVPGNIRRLGRFVSEVSRLWLSSLRARSQRGRRGWGWNRMRLLVERLLPRPRILHPYPSVRFRARLKRGAV
jgi:group II intron reverse transcriptase/maturase